MDNWFTIDRVDDNTYIISEYRHWEETHCYLLNGSERSLLIDTGLGISNIYDEVIKFTNKPITAVATHIHWDHIGGHKYFPNFYAHAAELDWLNGKFPLSMETILSFGGIILLIVRLNNLSAVLLDTVLKRQVLPVNVLEQDRILHLIAELLVL